MDVFGTEDMAHALAVQLLEPITLTTIIHGRHMHVVAFVLSPGKFNTEDTEPMLEFALQFADNADTAIYLGGRVPFEDCVSVSGQLNTATLVTLEHIVYEYAQKENQRSLIN